MTVPAFFRHCAEALLDWAKNAENNSLFHLGSEFFAVRNNLGQLVLVRAGYAQEAIEEAFVPFDMDDHKIACLLDELFPEEVPCNFDAIGYWLPDECELAVICFKADKVSC